MLMSGVAVQNATVSTKGEDQAVPSTRESSLREKSARDLRRMSDTYASLSLIYVHWSMHCASRQLSCSPRLAANKSAVRAAMSAPCLHPDNAAGLVASESIAGSHAHQE